MTWMYSDILILPEEDMRFGYGVQRGNVLPSLAYIPGRAVRGAMADWAIRNGLITDKDPAFLGIFGDTDKDDYTISYPWCYMHNRYPAPLSLFEPKSAGGKNYINFIPSRRTPTIYKGPFADYIDCISKGGNQPIDFLRRNEWPDNIEEFQMKAVTGVYESGNIHPAPGPYVSMHAPHDEKTGQVSKGGDDDAAGLFAQELMTRFVFDGNGPSNYYQGRLIFKKTDELLEFFSILNSKLYLNSSGSDWQLNIIDGALRNRAHGGHGLFFGDAHAAFFTSGLHDSDTEKQVASVDGKYSITFVSDLAKETNPYPLSLDTLSDLLEPVFGKESLIIEKNNVKIFSGRSAAYGYDVQHNQALPAKNTIAAGSCMLFEIENPPENFNKEMSSLQYRGMGENTRSGFGRFRVNWTPHKLIETKRQ